MIFSYCVTINCNIYCLCLWITLMANRGGISNMSINGTGCKEEFTMSFSLFFKRSCIALSLLLLACSGGGGSDPAPAVSSVPTLDAVTFSPTYGKAGDTIHITGMFGFTDPAGDLFGGSVRYTYGGTTYSVPISSIYSGITSGTASFSITANLNSSLGVVTVPVWLVDAAGNQSNTINVEFRQTLSPAYASSAGEDGGNAVAVDATGIYVTGQTNCSRDGSGNLIGCDVFVARYNASLVEQWKQTFSTAGDDRGNGIAVDASGVYVAGYTEGNLSGATSNGDRDAFLMRLNKADGSLAWATPALLGTASADAAYGVAVDPSGNVYITGYTQGTIPGALGGAKAGESDIFVAKYNASGTLQYVHQVGTSAGGTSNHDLGLGVAADASNVYICGYTGAYDGGGYFTGYDSYVARFAASDLAYGAHETAAISTTADDIAYGIAVRGTDLFVAGTTQGNLSGTNQGYDDAFIAKLATTTLSAGWVRQFGTPGNDIAFGVTVDAAGHAYVTGNRGVTVSASGNIYIAKYDNAGGTQLWLQQYDPGYGFSYGASYDLSGNMIYATGFVENGADPADSTLWKFDALGIIQ